MISNGILSAESSDRNSFSSACLLIRLCMLRLDRIGLDELAKLEMSAGML